MVPVVKARIAVLGPEELLDVQRKTITAGRSMHYHSAISQLAVLATKSHRFERREQLSPNVQDSQSCGANSTKRACGKEFTQKYQFRERGGPILFLHCLNMEYV